MSLFKKAKTREGQVISTASLPDIVFILLFFFMVTMVMKTDPKLVKIIQPDASEATKITKRSLVSHIYIGTPFNPSLGDQPRVQLNDAIREVKDVVPFIIAATDQLPEENKAMMIVSLEVDAVTEMGIVTDVKQEIRKTEARKVNYSTRKKMQK